MIRRLWSATALILLLCPLGAFAQHHSQGQDSVQFFQDIHIPTGQSAGDAVCFFCSVQVEGALNGDAVVFFGKIHNSGQIQGDAVAIIGSITLANQASVGGDVAVIGGLLNASPDAVINGDHVIIPAALILLQLLLLFGILIALIYGIVWLLNRSRQPACPRRP